MPIDPTIFLRGYKGSVDPTDIYARAAQIKAQQQEGQLRQQQINMGQMQMSELQKHLQEQDAMKQAAQGAFQTPAPVTTQQPTLSSPGGVIPSPQGTDPSTTNIPPSVISHQSAGPMTPPDPMNFVQSLNLPGGQSTVQGPAQFDPNKYVGNLNQAGLPMEAMQFQQSHMAQAQAQAKLQAEIEHTKAETLNQLSLVPEHQIDTVTKHLDLVGQTLMPSLQAQPGQEQPAWEAGINNLVKSGVMSPQEAQQHMQFPGREAVIAQYAATKAGQEYLKQKQEQANQTNPLVNPTESKLAVLSTMGNQTASDAMNKITEQKKASRPVNNLMTTSDATDIADAIERGDQPPTLKGLYRNAAPVRAELARRGFNLTQAETDWNAVQRHVQTLNGTQQVRLQQAISTAGDSLDKIEGLYNEWKQVGLDSGIKIFNHASLIAAKNLPGRAGAVASALDAQIADLTAELGVVYMGGNSPTDHGLALAKQNLSADWNEQTFAEGLKQARANISIRKNSILNTQPVGISPNSAYAPHQAQQPSQNSDPLGIR